MTNQNKTRDSFIFYRSFFSATKHLNQVEKAQLFEAICSYALDGNLIDLQGMSQGMFELIKPQLDANRKRFENGCVKKQKGSKKEAKNKQKRSKEEANVNVNHNVNVNEECKSELINENSNLMKNHNIENNFKGADFDTVKNNFDEFWNFYTPVAGRDGSFTPKGNKSEALQVYNKAIQKFTHEKIMANLEFYLKDCQKNARFTKHACSWLRGALKDNFEFEVSLAIQPEKTQQKLTKEEFQDKINEEFLKKYNN
jgi:hypothetical protein